MTDETKNETENKTNSAMPDFGEGLRKVFLAGVGAIAATAEKGQELVNDLVKRGAGQEAQLRTRPQGRREVRLAQREARRRLQHRSQCGRRSERPGRADD